MKTKSHVLLLTGKPGIGKTTIIRSVADQLTTFAGFYTQEIRINGERKGFELICFDGRKYVLAHMDFNKQYQVSKYGVDKTILEKIAKEVLSLQLKSTIFLIDEIGKMECFSANFINAMRELLNSDNKVVATTSRIDTDLYHILSFDIPGFILRG